MSETAAVMMGGGGGGGSRMKALESSFLYTALSFALKKAEFSQYKSPELFPTCRYQDPP